MHPPLFRSAGHVLFAALACPCCALLIQPARAGQAVPTLTMQGNYLVWTPIPDAVSYDVIRGDLAILKSTRGDFTLATHECVDDDHVGTSMSYSAALSPGQGSWFLVRGVYLAGMGNGTYDSGSSSQVGSRDAEIAASTGACPDVDPEEQLRALLPPQVFGLSNTDFVHAMAAAGRAPNDGAREVRMNGPGAGILQTPDWYTLHHGRDRASDTLSIQNSPAGPVTLFVRIIQEQLDQNSGPPSLVLVPQPQPFGAPIYRPEIRALERSFALSLAPVAVLTINAAEVRAIGLIAAVAGDFSQHRTLNVNYQIAGLEPAFFRDDPTAPLCSAVCDPVISPFCWICSTHYGCPSTHPRCLATSYSTCWGYWLDENTCACFP